MSSLGQAHKVTKWGPNELSLPFAPIEPVWPKQFTGSHSSDLASSQLNLVQRILMSQATINYFIPDESNPLNA